MSRWNDAFPNSWGAGQGRLPGENDWRLAGFFDIFWGGPFLVSNALRKQIFIARWISSSRLCFRRCINRRKICKFGLRHKLLGGRYLVLATIGQLKIQDYQKLNFPSVDDLWWISWVKACNRTGIETHPSQPLLHLKLLKHQMPKLHGPPPWQWKWVTVGDNG